MWILTESTLLSEEQTIPVRAGKYQAIWLTIKIPSDARAGKYTGAVRLTTDTGSASLPLYLTVPVADVAKTITLATPEKLWWKRLVYRRRRADGFDLIVHLVRIPPTEKWDINWADEPVPLERVSMTVELGKAVVPTVQACRPYQFEEPQQVVQHTLAPSAAGGKVAVAIPPFRYHTMVVFRVRTKK